MSFRIALTSIAPEDAVRATALRDRCAGPMPGAPRRTKHGHAVVSP